MRELQIKVESLDVEVNVSVEDEKLYLQQKQQDANYEKIIDFQKDNFFFLYSGALIIPFIWLRWFDFNNFEKVTYLMLPSGYSEVKQLRDTIPGQNIRNFSIIMCLQKFTDIVKVQTDISGKMLSFHSEVNQITIKIQSQ